MAITIQQQPTSPGMANSDYLFAVTSNSSSQPQYQFICDVYISGSASYVQRIKQQPNPSGTGVFNLGQIIHTYLESDNTWKTLRYTTASQVAKRFIVRFGEEYGTSLSSSINVYNGITNATTGSPALTGSSYYYVANGLVEPYDAVNWNFPSASYYDAIATPNATSFNYQNTLSNAPTTQSIQLGEYATISLINGNFDGSTTLAQDIYTRYVSYYDASGNLISTRNVRNITTSGGGPRTASASDWSTSAANLTSGQQLITMGVGPQNFADDSSFAPTGLPSGTAYYTVRLLAQASSGSTVENQTGSFADIRFNVEGPQCGYDGVRFAWKNEFGVWDYYTFTLQSDSTFAIQRQAYDQSFVNYSTTSTTVSYDKTRRGTSQFYNALDQTRTANSNWLTQAEADWLRELFFSADVYQQVGSDFFPIAITSANLVERTNPRTQRTFQYQIEFKPANQLRPRE